MDVLIRTYVSMYILIATGLKSEVQSACVFQTPFLLRMQQDHSYIDIGSKAELYVAKQFMAVGISDPIVHPE